MCKNARFSRGLYFETNEKQVYKQIGNSVAVPVVYRIAENIVKHLIKGAVKVSKYKIVDLFAGSEDSATVFDKMSSK